jgi:hypothetical protein
LKGLGRLHEAIDTGERARALFGNENAGLLYNLALTPTARLDERTSSRRCDQELTGKNQFIPLVHFAKMVGALLECGSLLPPWFGEACFALFDPVCTLQSHRQQAAATQGASKLAHSKV